MFYFLLAPILTYNWILILAAVVPAVFLMVKAYQSDRLEKESPAFLWVMVESGIISTIIALVIEKIGSLILDSAVPSGSPLYNVILYFVIVGFAEEGSKFFMLYRRSWHSPEFNCQYDGVVYALFVSLGFALWENISYVLHYGFSTAVVRAVTAIPGHACFGVFMGVFYGLARGYAYLEKNSLSCLFRALAVVVPAIIHGTYDYIASVQTQEGSLIFLGFIAVLFILSFALVNHMSRNDHYFEIDRHSFFF